MDIVNNLPDEMWLKILEYLPLHDRFEWVKFTNKRFFHLAGDISAVQDLDFHGCSYVSNDHFLEIINRSKDSVRFLSFRDCAWFSNQICTTVPRLKNLVTLDILGCFLNSETLHSLLGATCSIKRLAPSTTELVMTDICRLQSKCGLSLLVLHVELLHDPGKLCSIQTRTALRDFIRTCCHSNPHGVSFQTHKQFDLQELKDMSWEGNLKICKVFTQSVVRDAYDQQYQTDTLVAVPLHQDGCPPYLRDEHYDELALPEAVFLNHSIRKVTHLDLSNSHALLNYEFQGLYTKLPSFTNLVELNVCGLDLDANMLLSSIMDLKHLVGLSFSLHLPLQCKQDPNQNVLNFTTTETRDSDASCRYSVFLWKLVKNFPNLEKLEMRYRMNAQKYTTVSNLEAIGMLTKLRYLSLHRFPLNDVDQLANILSKCTNIASLDLGHFETDVACEFSKCFGSLRNLIYLRLAHDDLESVSKFKNLHVGRNLQRFTLYSKSTLSAAWIETFLGPVVATCDLFCMCHIECQNVDADVGTLIAVYQYICDSKYRGKVILSCSDDRSSQHPVCQSWRGRSFSHVARYSPFDVVRKPLV